MKQLTRAEVEHIQKALDEFDYLIKEYPEIVTNDTEDQLAIAKEIME